VFSIQKFLHTQFYHLDLTLNEIDFQFIFNSLYLLLR
jgi:hypothetical protein